MSLQSNALISFTEFMNYAQAAGLENISDDDTFIENMINYKTDEFHKYLRVDQLKSQSYTDYIDGTYSDKLYPVRWLPIISVTSIYDDVNWDYGASTLIDSDNYIIATDGNYIQLKYSYYFNKGLKNIKFTHTAGYATIPGDIKLACIKDVYHEFLRKNKFHITSESFGEGSVTYVESGLLESTKDVLDNYGNIGIA